MFATWWAERFGTTPPLGYLLRKSFLERWVRFHSLPDSKRYADDADERELLLTRQLAIAERLLGSGKPCYVVVARYETTLGSVHRLTEFDDLDFVCELAFTDEVETYFAVTTASFAPTQLRTALLAIANDELCVLWINANTGEVFAPYDGGVDCLLSSTTRRDELAATFQPWLSPRADGL